MRSRYQLLVVSKGVRQLSSFRRDTLEAFRSRRRKAFVGGNSFVIEHTLISAERQILLPTIFSLIREIA